MPLYQVVTDRLAFGKKHYFKDAIIDAGPGDVKGAELLCKLRKLKPYDGEFKKPVDLPDEVMARASRVEPLTEEAEGEPIAPKRRGRPPKYRTRDLTAGRTGEESE